jgi:tetratricopeptide (TPR) repeat protein
VSPDPRELLQAAAQRRVAGDFDAAAALAEEAARRMPKEPAPRLEAALAHAAAGRYAEAESAARKALRLRPGFVPVILLLVDVLGRLGKAAEALVQAKRAAALAPQLYEARFALAGAYFDLQNFADAAAEFEAAAGLRPEAISATYNRARALINLGRGAEAQPLLEDCIAREPAAEDAYENLAVLHAAQDRVEALFELCDRAIARCARTASFWQLKADSHLRHGNAEACLDCHASAVAAAERESSGDALAQIHVNRGLALLTLGRYAEGWREMRWRWNRAEAAQHFPGFVLDPLQLPRDLSGRRVLIAHEQGIGDEIFFLRYAPQLRERGATLVYHGEPKLFGLLGLRSDLFEGMLTAGGRIENIDLTVLSGDLPEACGGAVAAPLALPAAPLREAWQKRLASAGPPPYVGVTWRAGLSAEVAFQARRGRLHKKVPVEDLASSLKDLKGTVVILQRHPAPGEIECFNAALGRPVFDATGANENLLEMLGLLGALDGYVCVSNANAHLAASIGLKIHVLVAREPEWRWGASGVSTPWFPGFFLLRQSADGSWTKPLAELAHAGLGDKPPGP